MVKRMSDPVSRKDEEVIISVRRKLGQERPDEELGVNSVGRDRLVLTPQLRVDDEAVLRLEPQHAQAAQTKDEVTAAKPEADLVILSEKIAAFEMAIGRIPDQWEPDGTGTDAYAGSAMPAMSWSDLDQADEGAQHEADVPSSDPQPAAEPVRLLLDAQRIDKDVLRDLVAEILRSELKGQLRESLAEDMRALVRKEIQLALAARPDKHS